MIRGMTSIPICAVVSTLRRILVPNWFKVLLTQYMQGDREELLKELERTKKKQEELNRLIHSLTKQSRRLSKTRMEVCSSHHLHTTYN